MLNVLFEQRRKIAEAFPAPEEEISRKSAEVVKQIFLSTISTSEISEQFQEQAGKLIENFSRPHICGSAIVEITDLFLMSSLQMAITSPIMFALNFDVLIGLGKIGASVLEAEEGIRGTADDLLSQKISRFETEDEDLTFIYRKEIVKSCATLLIKDPTGFLLVDETVRGIKGKKDSPLKDHAVFFKRLPVDQNFAIAGAELGAELYKKLYPFCPEPKISPKPSIQSK